MICDVRRIATRVIRVIPIDQGVTQIYALSPLTDCSLTQSASLGHVELLDAVIVGIDDEQVAAAVDGDAVGREEFAGL